MGLCVHACVRPCVCVQYFLFSQPVKDFYESSIHISSQGTLCKDCTGGSGASAMDMKTLESSPAACATCCSYCRFYVRLRKEGTTPSEYLILNGCQWRKMLYAVRWCSCVTHQKGLTEPCCEDTVTLTTV